MPAKELTGSCMDCKDADAVLTTRNRSLCGPCYQVFLEHKVYRRMERYRKYPDPGSPSYRLLLPLSLGVSSSSLLRMLDTGMNRQLAKNARTSYTIEIIAIEPFTHAYDEALYTKRFEAARETFSKYTFNRIPLHSIFDYVPNMTEAMREYVGSQFKDDTSRSNEERLAAFRGANSTATSKADLDNVLFTQLVVGYAKQTGCESILWADSDTSLAAKTLAGAAKGRGAALTWQVSDAMSPWGVRFDFPCRDISKPELALYESVSPDLSDIVIPDEPLSENILTKNLSIDELMLRYVTTQGEKYPGVMANVSRTANKLDSYSSLDSTICSLCSAIVDNVKGNETGITVASQFSVQKPQFCYGCTRSRPEIDS
ncbi:hypothetical protein N7456_003763 [Penicillium angulare]|uniref:Cytoplasmic tRNA 2-thiolation protein 2 n=1 Tax=Penicillium angulare TaxID=116970 RepID=A0A9W9FVE0_9EURO|nr:hypothetical protein N7456_003763 [Penicillium angulare]